MQPILGMLGGIWGKKEADANDPGMIKSAMCSKQRPQARCRASGFVERNRFTICTDRAEEIVDKGRVTDWQSTGALSVGSLVHWDMRVPRA